MISLTEFWDGDGSRVTYSRPSRQGFTVNSHCHRVCGSWGLPSSQRESGGFLRKKQAGPTALYKQIASSVGPTPPKPAMTEHRRLTINARGAAAGVGRPRQYSA